MQLGVSHRMLESILSSNARCYGASCCLQDQALRAWNIQTKVCVAMLHGDGGHRNEILSVVKSQAQGYCRLMHDTWVAMMCWHIAYRYHVCMSTAAHTRLLHLQDFHPTDVNQFVSAGMDNAIKIWSLTGELLLLALAASAVPPHQASLRPCHRSSSGNIMHLL